MHDWSFDFLRRQIVGIDSAFDTPFGRRLMVYCDYTASGRCLIFVERYLQTLQRGYANTHTEDDVTGRSMSRLLHEAEAMIKRAVNAGPRRPHRRLRHRAPPARSTSCSRSSAWRCRRPRGGCSATSCEQFLGDEKFEAFRAFQQSHQPVVFVGPLRAPLERGDVAAGPRDRGRGEPRAGRRRGPRAPRVAAAAARVPGPPAHRLVLGGLERHRHALAGARDRAAPAPPRRLRLLRLRRERALRRDRHEPAARPRRRRRVDRRGVPLAAQVPRRARARAACWCSTSACTRASCRRASAAAARWTT